MKETLSTLVATAVLLLGAPGASSADVKAGLDAYESGDYETARREWLPLAEAGSAAAQFNMGLLHFHGMGVPKDPEEAARWYRLAAEQGFARAQYALAAMYEEGSGVPRNEVLALTWFTLAGKQRYEDARKRRKQLAKTMTSHQIAYAELEARELTRKMQERGKGP